MSWARSPHVCGDAVTMVAILRSVVVEKWEEDEEEEEERVREKKQHMHLKKSDWENTEIIGILEKTRVVYERKKSGLNSKKKGYQKTPLDSVGSH